MVMPKAGKKPTLFEEKKNAERKKVSVDQNK